MRIVVALIALIAVGAMGIVAHAQTTQDNEYTLQGSFSPNQGKASKKDPRPVGLDIGWDVTEVSNLRPAVVETYLIGVQGAAINGRLFPKCTSEKINGAGTDKGCSKAALMGSGTIRNDVGNDKNFADKSIKCDAAVRIYNGGDHAALFIDGRPPTCAVSLATAIKAPYVKMPGIGGVGFKFTVPSNLRHPIPGVSLAVKQVRVSFGRKTVRRGGKTRGFFEAQMNCPKSRKVKVEAVFTSESGASKTSSSALACRP